MSEQQTSDNESDFLAGFAGTTGTESPAAPVAEDKQEQKDEQAAEPEQAQKPDESAEQTPKEEPQRFAGFTEDELKNLLARAAKVDELETLVRKAHGKIGELNGRLQEVAKAPAPAQQPKSEQMDLSHVEEDYPDIVGWVRSQMGQKEPKDEVQPQAQQPEPAQEQGASAELIQLALMDHLHKGWREKVQSQDFNLWLAASGDDVRNAYQTAATAEALGGILSGYDAWQAKKGQRIQSANQRLEQAMTPQGSAGKPKTAPSPEDAFQAGFKSVFAR